LIQSFRHKGLRRVFEDGDHRGVPAEMARRIGTMLAALDDAQEVEELNLPSFRLHQLKGDLLGLWAVTVRANWRIVFRFESGQALDVDFVDYH
jgi:proteic killer suppression protein